MPSYFQVLTAVISFAVSNPGAFKKLWDLIVAGYQASVDLINGIKDELPDVQSEGTLQFVAPATDEELDAEDRLAKLISPDSEAFVDGKNFRKIFAWLQSSEIGKALLKKLIAGVLGS